MVGEICVHEKDERASGRGQSVNVRGAEAHFARSQHEPHVLLAEHASELLRHFPRPVTAVVLDYNHLPRQVAARSREKDSRRHVPFPPRLGEAIFDSKLIHHTNKIC